MKKVSVVATPRGLLSGNNHSLSPVAVYVSGDHVIPLFAISRVYEHLRNACFTASLLNSPAFKLFFGDLCCSPSIVYVVIQVI